MTLFETEIIESSKRSVMLKSRVWTSCFSDSEWLWMRFSAGAGMDDSKVEYCIGLTVLKIWMVGNWGHFGNLCSFKGFFGVSPAFAAVFGRALNGTYAHLCVIPSAAAPQGLAACEDPECIICSFITLAQTSKEISELRGTLWSRGMQDKKGKTVNRVGLLGVDD